MQLSDTQTKALHAELNRRLLAYDKLFTFVNELATNVVPDDIHDKAQALIDEISVK